MKFFAVASLLAVPELCNGFSIVPTSKCQHSFSTSLDGAVVYYSTSTGNTETVAGYIAEAAGVSAEDIGDASPCIEYRIELCGTVRY